MQKSASLGYLISRLDNLLQQELDTRLQLYGLDHKLWPILYNLWQEEGITQTELCKRCDLPGYSMTRSLDQLQSQGYVNRIQETDNRRAFNIFLTNEAKAMEADVICEVNRIENQYLAILTEQEKSLLFRLLNKINQD